MKQRDRHAKLAEDLWAAADEPSRRFAENPFSWACDKVFSATPVKVVAEISDIQDTIRLAMISLQPPASQKLIPCDCCSAIQGVPDEQRHSCHRRLIHLSQTGAKELYRSYKWALETALKAERKADIICVNELGFPAANYLPWPPAQNLSWRLAQKYKSLIVAGTSHDCRSMYNTGYIYYPGNDCPREGLSFHKQVSAIAVGERVCVPPERQTLSLRAFGLKISVVICLDFLDFSTTGSIVKKSETIDLLLVPAFTPSTVAFKKMALAVSEAMAGGVAIVNHYNSQGPPRQFFTFGQRATDPDSGFQKEEITGNGAIITLYDIKYTEFNNKKTKCISKCDKDLRWLFDTPVFEQVT